MMDTSKVRKPYIPLIESPGIVYLVNNEMVVTSTYTVVINAVTKAWPILAFIYLAAMLSGIVVWALVKMEILASHLIILILFVRPKKGQKSFRSTG